MAKKTSDFGSETIFKADDFAEIGKNRLSAKQIREFSKVLMEVPDHAALPDWTHLTVGDRLAIVSTLIPAEQLENLMGSGARYAISRYRTGAKVPVDAVAALAAETMLPVDWIVSGRAQARQPPLVRITPDNPQADPDDVPIQKLAFKAAAGRGALILDELADHVRFPRAILAHVGVAPQHARLMEASGESMKETIHDGDTLLVDVSPAAVEIVEGKIYVFGLGNEAYVKRLRRTGDAVIMISDNRELFPPEEAPRHLPMRIFGRVKWAGRSL
ncbi:S24 family peptidase [Nitrobacter winogradskyi]|nr:S24 family peptidase [Nitrobacter winogradskyi]